MIHRNPAGRMLVDVAASGVNRADILQRSGDYVPPAGESAVPGLELAGTVRTAEKDGGYAPGDRVAALVGSGAHGAQCWVTASHCLPIPVGFPATQAAAMPEALTTAWWNLVHLGELRAGETVLIYGANSGVGHVMVQVALHLGARVVAGVRGSRWNAELRDWGAMPVDTTASDAADKVRETAPDGVDIVTDLIGAANASLTTEVLGRHGRWLSIGLLGGADISLSLRDVIRKRWHITGSSIRSLTPDEKALAIAGVRDQLWPAVLAGQIAARLHRVLPADDIDEAWSIMDAGGFLGKIVIDRQR